MAFFGYSFKLREQIEFPLDILIGGAWYTTELLAKDPEGYPSGAEVTLTTKAGYI